MVMMTVPMIVAVAVRFMLGIVPLFVTPSLHGLLEIFRPVRVIVVLTQHPLIQQGVALVDPCL